MLDHQASGIKEETFYPWSESKRSSFRNSYSVNRNALWAGRSSSPYKSSWENIARLFDTQRLSFSFLNEPLMKSLETGSRTWSLLIFAFYQTNKSTWTKHKCPSLLYIFALVLCCLSFQEKVLKKGCSADIAYP